MDLRREETGAATRDVSGLRFNSLTLDELSKELERCTEETQRLQDEVEHATRAALEKFGYTSKHFCTTGMNQGQRDVSPTIKAQETALHLRHLSDDVMHLCEQPVEHVKHRDPSERQNDRMEELIASVGQEVEMLNHKLNSSQDNGVCISTKLELLRTSLQQQLKTGDQNLCRLQEEVQNPGGERKQARPEENDHKTKRQPSRLEEAQRRYVTLLAEKETLRLELEDRDKMRCSGVSWRRATRPSTAFTGRTPSSAPK
ncbi:uncharacterized protein LOC133474891 [Phyllopteryx taeniolatus]|uniref:uncharacterized protein LOC133474891 n=1 Tax=Phyllopteryx taeniolatus TaxID=161469 RepID=UPI002AD26C0A|nr:uncharacterized protein LOC133474891 [Phyllopteryx taeniolatus]